MPAQPTSTARTGSAPEQGMVCTVQSVAVSPCAHLLAQPAGSARQSCQGAHLSVVEGGRDVGWQWWLLLLALCTPQPAAGDRLVQTCRRRQSRTGTGRQQQHSVRHGLLDDKGSGSKLLREYGHALRATGLHSAVQDSAAQRVVRLSKHRALHASLELVCSERCSKPAGAQAVLQHSCFEPAAIRSAPEFAWHACVARALSRVTA
jgi:hypothetical protein